MQIQAIMLVVLLVSGLSYSEPDNPNLRTSGGLSRRDRIFTSTTATPPNVISEKKIEEEEPKEIPKEAEHENPEKSIPKAKETDRTILTVEERTFGRDGLRNIMLGGALVAVINIAPILLSGLKTIINLGLPILGLLLFRRHSSFRYFDDFMDMFEEYVKDGRAEDEPNPDKEVVQNDEYTPPQNYPYTGYDYNYYSTNPYRAYGF